MIQSLFILSAGRNGSNEIVIEKHWRGVTPRSCVDLFWEEVRATTGSGEGAVSSYSDVRPVIVTAQHYLISVYRCGMFFLAVLTAEVAPLLVIEFLHRVVDTLVDYFGAKVDDGTLKSNFTTVYQVLEEMLDNGHPMITEPNALRGMVAPPSVLGRIAAAFAGSSNVSNKLPGGTVSSIPWRRSGIKYAQNEFYLDIEEEINCTIDRNGVMASCDVTGIGRANCKLSGMPDVMLSFMNPSLLENVELHPCIRHSVFERDRVFSFVPPDGKFTLFKYSVANQNGSMVTSPPSPVYCKPTVSYNKKGGGSIEIMLGSKPMMARGPTDRSPATGKPIRVEDVKVVFALPSCVRSTDLTTNHGGVLCEEASKVCCWDIGRIPEDRSPKLTGTFELHPGIGEPEEAITFSLNFAVPSTTISGIKVRQLDIQREAYTPYKGVRSKVKAGKFEVRT